MNTSEFVFMIGAPRSGSTWLQLMLGSHPEVATGQESQVFNEYISVLYKRWQQELQFSASEAVRQHGIATYITEDEFLDLLRHFVGRIFEKSLSLKPGARYFLEKSPNSSPHVELIDKCFPKAKFIHIVRDGRDVATSLLMAAKGWGKSWAPNRIERAASVWRDSVTDARKAKKFGARYIEVRYEDLKTNGQAELGRLFAFLNVDSDRRQIERIYSDFSFDRMVNDQYEKNVFINGGDVIASGTGKRREPPGFIRKGEVGSWDGFLSPRELDIFNWVAGELLVDTGYATGAEVRKPSVMPFSLMLRESMEAGAGRIKAKAKAISSILSL